LEERALYKDRLDTVPDELTNDSARLLLALKSDVVDIAREYHTGTCQTTGRPLYKISANATQSGTRLSSQRD
jgi:hypothetical protein